MGETATMRDISYVIQRIDAGDKVRCFEDFYGRQWIELRRPWLLFHKKRYSLTNDQMMTVRQALSQRRHQRSARAAQVDQPRATH